MTLTDIRKVPDASIILERIKETVPSIHPLELELVEKILDTWNEEWIDYIAENDTGKSDGTERSNDKRLKRRISKLGGVDDAPDNIGF